MTAGKWTIRRGRDFWWIDAPTGNYGLDDEVDLTPYSTWQEAWDALSAHLDKVPR